MFCTCLLKVDRLTAGTKNDIPISRAFQFIPITTPSGQTCPSRITFKCCFVTCRRCDFFFNFVI